MRAPRFRLRIRMIAVAVIAAILILLIPVINVVLDWGLAAIGVILVTPELLYPVLGALLLIGAVGGAVGTSVFVYGELTTKRK